MKAGSFVGYKVAKSVSSSSSQLPSGRNVSNSMLSEEQLLHQRMLEAASATGLDHLATGMSDSEDDNHVTHAGL